MKILMFLIEGILIIFFIFPLIIELIYTIKKEIKKYGFNIDSIFLILTLLITIIGTGIILFFLNAPK